MEEVPPQTGQGQHPSWDYYAGWSVEIRKDDTIRISHSGYVVTMTAEQWIKMAQGVHPESKHIDAVMRAIDWHFGPSDRLKIRQKYLELVNEEEAPA